MQCTICGIGSVHVQYDRQPLCKDCYNAIMSEKLGVDLPELPETFSAADANGIQRIFEVERLIMGTAILLTARERWDHGYEFAVDGELDADQHTLFDQLQEKTKRGMSKTYLETGKYSNGQTYTAVKEHHLIGVLSYDETDSETPLVIIDGKPYNWEEVGRLLQAFEGFQVKIEMKELAEEYEE
ncbi:MULTISPECIES: hypothetical protein [unclassified Sporosarcina]|uniref:DUF7713 domain-containing protein n=1 Tax=unclassified Sporosarcina TaxID=2647733 RepID=UPI0020418A73|nr:MULTISPECIES: hypothetical protein [unclassified Sporosarcina]GKV65901.1 hypothetical protein NCCP2331_20540 [Sporosarcina sp. NCCP-2331]GLB56099.1 hypothetical protein NCCP2378_18860 [Sporosarcina sp. NCCP-2378]